MKKRIAAILLATVCTFSLAACGQEKPSLDEVEKAISEGNVTVEDALEKGWVTQEWADSRMEQNAVPAGDKMQAGTIGDFSTTTINGEKFTKGQMSDVSLFAFLDPSDPDAVTFYQALVDGYNGVKENGAEILVCIKGEDKDNIFSDAPFPVISYNDSLKSATESHSEMIEDMPNTASWCVNGSFLSAWYFTADAEGLADSAASFVKIQKEMAEEDVEDGGMAVMG